MVAVVAGLIAAVKLAGVESIELQNRSPRVQSAISDLITLARIHRGQQSEMNWHQAKAQARRVVDEAQPTRLAKHAASPG